MSLAFSTSGGQKLWLVAPKVGRDEILNRVAASQSKDATVRDGSAIEWHLALQRERITYVRHVPLSFIPTGSDKKCAPCLSGHRRS